MVEKSDDDFQDDLHFLYEQVKKFIKDNRITCPETIYQSDRVVENSYAFIKRLCDIVGYQEEEEETE